MADREAYTKQAVRALLAAARHEHDFSGWLARALADVAGQLGGGHLVTIGRPGSWEASHVQALLAGTIGDEDSCLPPPVHKLTDRKARAIRDMALYGEDEHGAPIARNQIAVEFGVSPSTVRDIASGRTWAWLAEEDEHA